MTILVTGATGNVGRIVVELLAAAGQRVRALCRNPDAVAFPDGVHSVRGDLRQPGTLRDALRGVDSVYLFPVAATAEEVVALAKQAGVRRIVVLSSGAVTGGYDTDFHYPVEQAVERSGLRWTHVRAGEFMLNKLWLWGPSVRAQNVVREPYPDMAWYPVHERDIADVAVAALLEDGHGGAAYDVNGPELISRRTQVEAIAAATGRQIRLEVVTREQAREMYLAQGGFAAANADFLLGYVNYSGTATDSSGTVAPSGTAADADGASRGSESVSEFDPSQIGPLPTARQVTGRPARTFAQWAVDHAADFR